jgi:SAM-dependent methyltransferase
MDWRIKGVIQGTLARAPAGMWLNDRLQALAGGRRDIGQHVDAKVTLDWLVHARHLDQLGWALPGRRLLEVGTGWLPVMPLCFAVAGFGRSITVDLHRHLQLPLVRPVLLRLERHLPAMALACGQPLGTLQTRWHGLTQAGSGLALLEAAGIEYHAPANATRTGLAAGSVDLVFSNSVLEHVPEPVLHALMQETRRVLSPEGLALHNVNCGDHYAYFDRAITPIHYLRYTEAQWRRWNNDILFQNRLRAVDFLAAAQAAGLETVLDTHRGRPELMARMHELPIAAQFRHYPASELCCTSLDFAARVRRG